jgi:hypothetical protein
VLRVRSLCGCNQLLLDAPQRLPVRHLFLALGTLVGQRVLHARQLGLGRLLGVRRVVADADELLQVVRLAKQVAL